MRQPPRKWGTGTHLSQSPWLQPWGPLPLILSSRSSVRPRTHERTTNERRIHGKFESQQVRLEHRLIYVMVYSASITTLTSMSRYAGFTPKKEGYIRIFLGRIRKAVRFSCWNTTIIWTYLQETELSVLWVWNYLKYRTRLMDLIHYSNLAGL